MPIYEYRCTTCEEEFEVLVRSSTVVSCPKCGAQEVERLVSRIAPHGKIPEMRRKMRAMASAEGDTSNFSKKELSTFKS
ncbi:FmdB family zinc ribbon protein [Derxia gummosa]|uniref:FmdB family zinc ribbon protein n=1 Tax=Derxia gummosa DSM 723 TaxID=1121388 RepID=A0A8B6X6V8_9BURK|nr:zinc ribbon domain-containing protein [Derxia gummosa]